MNARVDFKHLPAFCPRATAMVALIEAEELEAATGNQPVHALDDSHSIPQTMIQKNKPTTVTQAEVAVPTISRVLAKEEKEINSIIFQIKSRVKKSSSPATYPYRNRKP